MPRATLLSTLLLAGCAAPLQNGDTVIAAGWDQRLGVMCRYKNGASAKQVSDLCGEAADDRARIAVLTDAECASGGCRAGDVVLENRAVRIVVAGTPVLWGGVERPPGTIVGARLDGVPAGEGLCVVPSASLGAAALKGLRPAGASVADDGAAILDLVDKQAGASVRYRLPPEGPVLKIVTSVPRAVGDDVRLVDAFALPPRQEVRAYGAGWIFAGADASVAYADLGKRPDPHGSPAVPEAQWELAGAPQGDKLVFSRALAWTEGGTLSAAAAIGKLTGRSLAPLRVGLDTDWTQPPEGARVVLERDGRTLWAPLRAGHARWLAPAGAWAVRVEAEGLRSEAEPVHLDDGHEPTVRLSLPIRHPATPLP